MNIRPKNSRVMGVLAIYAPRSWNNFPLAITRISHLKQPMHCSQHKFFIIFFYVLYEKKIFLTYFLARMPLASGQFHPTLLWIGGTIQQEIMSTYFSVSPAVPNNPRFPWYPSVPSCSVPHRFGPVPPTLIILERGSAASESGQQPDPLLSCESYSHPGAQTY